MTISVEQLLQDISTAVMNIESSLVGAGDLNSRVERIEHSLYGGAGEDMIITSASIANVLRSTNYVSGSSGWQIAKDGTVEFEEATIRGTIHATDGDFLGAVTIGTGGSLSSGQTAFGGGTGFWMEYNDGNPRFSIGDGGANSLEWDGSFLQVSNLFVAGTITVSLHGAISCGQADYDTGAGFWLDGGAITNPRFSLGESTGEKLLYDGEGNVTITGALNATSGNFTGAVTIGTGGSISSGQTDYDTGTGYWMDYNGGTPRISIGNAAGNKLLWNGTTLSITGTVQSSDYSAGLTGWKIDQAGTAEFQNVVIRGAIHSSVISYDEEQATSGTLAVPRASPSAVPQRYSHCL